MKITFILFGFALLLICEPLLSQHKIDLFNGKNLEGWYAFRDEDGKIEDANSVFNVEEGMIRMYGSKAGYLMSDGQYENFKLAVEFRWNTDSTFTRKSNKMNSGVMYLVPSDTPDELWPKGIQFQIKKGATGDFVLLKNTTIEINGETSKADKTVVVKRLVDATKPLGEWNSLEVIVKDGVVQQKLNGKLVNKGENPSVSKGRILLQYEGYPIDFRKVMLKNLR